MEKETDYDVVDYDDAALPKSEIAIIQDWLKPTDYDGPSSEYLRHLNARVDKTGLWLRDTDRYSKWQKSDNHGFLWVKGAPGAGKSVLSAATIHDLQESEDSEAQVLYFFFRQIIETNRTPISLIKDWLAQLLPSSIAIQGKLHAMAKHRQLVDVSEEELWQALLAGLSRVKRAYCVVDALDEMDQTNGIDFFQRLNDLAAFRPSTVKVLMTSRPRPDLNGCFIAPSIVHISLQEERVSQEVYLFVSKRLENLDIAQDLRQTLVKDVTAQSRGLFLYAKILCNEVTQALQRGQQPHLDTLPSNIQDMYVQTLISQAEKHQISQDWQMILLRCVTHCARPLRVRELAGILTFMVPDLALPEAKRIVKIACYPFLEILSDETVQVFHHSFTEFLLDNERQSNTVAGNATFPVLQPREIHKWLAITCMKITIQAETDYQSSGVDPALSLPFLDYSMEHWLHHLSHTHDDGDKDFRAMIEAMCMTRPLGFNSHNMHMDPGRNLTTPLRVAAFAGMVQLVHGIPNVESTLMAELESRKDGVFSREVIPWGESSLAIAIGQGHLEIVKLLWSGPIMDRLKEYHSALLRRACTSGSRDLVSFLLGNGCRPTESSFNINSDYVMKPHALELVLPYKGSEARILYMSRAAAGGRYDAVQAVVTATFSNSLNDAPAPWRAERFGTPLFQACSSMRKTSGHLECVRVLVPHHGDINAKEDVARMQYDQYQTFNALVAQESTVLHALAAKWSDENHHICVQMFRLLLAAGADVNAKDGEGQTPIMLLFWKGWVRSVYKPLRVLIEAGADIDVVDHNGNGLLMRALETTRDVGALRRLLHADANRKDGTEPQWGRDYWQSKLFLGAFWYNTNGPDGQKEVLDFLLDHGATIEDGQEPVKVVKGIFLHGDPESLRKALITRTDQRFLNELLHIAGHTLYLRPNAVSFIQVILESGGDINARDGEGMTPLMRAAASENVLEALLRFGADVKIKDFQDRTVLHHLFSYQLWPEAIVSWLTYPGTEAPILDCLNILLKQDCDLLARDRDGRNVLDWAMTLFVDIRNDDNWKTEIQVDVRKHWLLLTIKRLLENIKPSNGISTTALHNFFDLDARPLPRQLEDPQIFLPHILEILEDADPDFDLNYQDTEGFTPIHIAAIGLSNNGLPCLDLLREHRARLDLKTNDGRNMLHVACRARNAETLGYLCSNAPQLVSQTDHRGRSPLFEACLSGFPEVVAILLHHDASIGQKDFEGLTVFHACAEFFREQSIWESLSNKLEGNGTSKSDKERPFMSRHKMNEDFDLGGYAKGVDRVSEVHPLKGKIGLQLQNASHSICAVMRILFEEAKRIGTVDLQEIEPSLLTQIANDGGPFAQPLIQLWRELSRKDGASQRLEESQSQVSLSDDMMLPEAFLASCSLTDVDFLGRKDPETMTFPALQRSCDPRSLTSGWKSQFFRLAIEAGLSEILMTLATVCADVSRGKWSFEKGSPPARLMLFKKASNTNEVSRMLEGLCKCKSSALAMLQCLIQKCYVGANMEIQIGYMKEHTRLLHLLAEGQMWWHGDAIRWLVQNGASLEATDSKGQTTLHTACRHDGPWSGRMVDILLKLGADYEAKDNEGRTCTQGVRSNTVLEALAKNQVPFQDVASMGDLLLAIGRLDVTSLKIAIQSGLNVDQRVEKPVWTEAYYDPGYGGSPVHNGWEATPLLGALQFYEFEQNFWTKDHQDARAAIIRLLIEAGSNLLEPLQVRHLDVYEELFAERAEPPYDYCAYEQVDNELDRMPFLHGIFKYVRSLKRHLAIFFEYPEKIRSAVNVRGGHMNETLFLAACNARLDFQPRMASIDEEGGEVADEGDHVDNSSDAGPSFWVDATGFFVQMMDLGADVSATDREGNNALHILLKNPCIRGKDILAFLDDPRTHSLVKVQEPDGWTPLQLALKQLRPEVALRLLKVCPSLENDLLKPDPEGLTPLHRIATQILHEKMHISEEERNIERLPPQSPEYAEDCIRLWKACLKAGLSINVVDESTRGNPPVFHYFAQFRMNSRGTYYTTLYYPRLFEADGNGKESVDLMTKNRSGDSLLHAVVRACSGSDDYEASSVVRFLVENLHLNPLLEDKDGLSVLDLAAKNRLSRVCMVFKREEEKEKKGQCAGCGQIH